jgi:hypothetical protein
VYSERTQHVLIQESVGILDMDPPCTKHILAQYRGVCPQCQDVQIQQLAKMVNDLVGKTEEQAKAIKGLKESREEQRKVINQMTVKVIASEQYTKDIQKKVFPKVRRSRATWFLVSYH